MRFLIPAILLTFVPIADAALMPWCPCPACRTLPNNIHNRPRVSMPRPDRQGAIAVSPRPVPAAVLAPEPVAAAVYSTPKEAIDALIEMLQLGPDSHLIDLGCGEGSVIIAAAKQTGCSALGIEIDEQLAQKARDAREAAGLSSQQVTIMRADARAHTALYKGATHVFMYQHGHLSAELIELVPDNALVVTYHFPVPGKKCHRVTPRGHTFYLVER